MRAPPPPNPAHIAALFVRALMWLLRNLHRLFAGGPEARRAHAAIAKIVACLIVVRIGVLAPPPPLRRRRAHSPLSAPRGFAQRAGKHPVSAAIAVIVRGLRARTIGARLCALFAALLDPDPIAEQFLKRFSCGFTRLRPLLPVHPPADALTTTAVASASVFADTS